MNNLVRENEVRLAREAIKRAGLHLVEKKDLERLSSDAVASYEGYPLHDWLASGNANGQCDAKTSKLLMYTTLKTMVKDAVIYADSEEMNGFAAWMPFGFSGTKPLPFMLNGGVGLVMHAGIGFFRRLLSYDEYAMGLKKKFTDHYDWYLFNLSIKKEAQGRGIASRIMRPMLDFCDDRRMPAYLETNKETNVGLYRLYGFELMSEELIPNSPVTHYAMVRRPIEK